MLRNVHPQDVSIEPFKTHKRFQFGTADTGSGVYGLRGVSPLPLKITNHTVLSNPRQDFVLGCPRVFSYVIVLCLLI